MTTALDPTVAHLRGLAPFDQIPAGRLRAMGAHVDRLHVREGTVIARQGHMAREVVIVLDGDVLATRDGDEVVRGSAGTQIGADGLLDRRPHDCTWIASTDLEVVVVNGPAFRSAASVAA